MTTIPLPPGEFSQALDQLKQLLGITQQGEEND